MGVEIGSAVELLYCADGVQCVTVLERWGSEGKLLY